MKLLGYLCLSICIAPLAAQRAPFLEIDGSWAQKTLSTLSIDEKIGQLLVIAAVSDELLNQEFMQEAVYTMDQAYVQECIKQYHIGGIIFAGMGTAQKQLEITNYYQSRSAIPLLIVQDLEWGLSMRLKDCMRFPRAMTLGAVNNEQLIYAMSSEVARQAKLLGIHMILSPVVDVNNNKDNPVIADRSFGQEPQAVARKGTLFMCGLQDNGIIACAKHFPGHGDTNFDSHYDLGRIDHNLARLHAVELLPFKALINAGVQAVMTAHLDVPALTKSATHLPTSLSYELITNLLKKELDFHGLVVTDGLGMAGVTKNHQPGKIELEALLAGSDMLIMPVDVAKAHATIKQALLDGILSEQELDKRVLKILRAKEWAFAHNSSTQHHYERALLHTADACALKQQLYQESITIAHNSNNALPIIAQHHKKYAVLQIGDASESPFATTLQTMLPCSYYHLSSKPQKLACDLTKHNLMHAETIIIALFDMNKFAQQHFGVAQETRDLIKQLQQDNKKIILVLFGSPYSSALFENITATTIAYENDPDAQIAAARVITGAQKALGTLPVL